MDKCLERDQDKILPIKDIKVSVNFINELKNVLKQIESRLEKNEENAHRDQNTDKEKNEYKNTCFVQKNEITQTTESSNTENTPILIDDQKNPLNINGNIIHISNANQVNVFNVNKNVFSNINSSKNSPNNMEILGNDFKFDEIEQENTKKNEEKQKNSLKKEKEILYNTNKNDIYIIDEDINKRRINSRENFLAHDEKNAETDTDEKSSCKNDENYERISDLKSSNENTNLLTDNESNDKVEKSKKYEYSLSSPNYSPKKNNNTQKSNFKNLLENKEINEKKGDSEKKETHIINENCINKCINWTLKAEIKEKKSQNKKQCRFEGRSIFFNELDFSILNTLNKSTNIGNCFKKNSFNNDNNINYKNINERILNELKKESILQINEIKNSNDNETIKDILNHKYPLDNSKFNFDIINSNLCIKENLKRIFLLEFDLKKAENSEIFRKINDDCVDKEINFALNGKIHGCEIFKNDLTFSVGYREFIKSIQFRLLNFYNKNNMNGENNKKGNKWDYNRRININTSENSMYYKQTHFYAKILNSVNIGIEFYKPYIKDKLFLTNFNSIVNSNIELNQILIELTIPTIFMNNNLINNNIINDSINNDNTIGNSNIDIDIDSNINIDKNINDNINNNTIKKKEDIIENRQKYAQSAYSSPKKEYKNINDFNTYANFDNKSEYAKNNNNMAFKNFQNIYYQQNFSPLLPIISNKFQGINYFGNNPIVINNNIMNNPMNNTNTNNSINSDSNKNININNYVYPKSPSPNINSNINFTFKQNTYSPMPVSYLVMRPIPFTGNINQSMSVNSPYNMSNYSNFSGYSSPFINNNYVNMKSKIDNSRKYSEVIDPKSTEDLMDINRKIYNSNCQTPVVTLKMDNGEKISQINLQQYMSPKSMNQNTKKNFSNNFNNNYFNLFSLNPLTIRRRIEQLNKNDNSDNINTNHKKMNVELSGEKLVNVEQNSIKNVFILENQNKTNFDLFLKSVTPLYNSKIEKSFLKLKILNILENFKKTSLQGLKNMYYYKEEIIYLSYLLSLSSLSVKITNKTLKNEIVSELSKTNKSLERYNKLKDKEEIQICLNQFVLYFSNEYILISFAENKPVHYRNSYFKQLKELKKELPFFVKLNIEDIDLMESFFSILYSPLSSTKEQVNYTSFLVYYQFTKEINKEMFGEKKEKINDYEKLTVCGILPLNLNAELFLQRINLIQYLMNIPVAPMFQDFCPYYSNNAIILRNMIYFVLNEVSKHVRCTSYDYDRFIKINNYNFINQWGYQ